ncbi:proline-rich protein 29-like [Labeo rohita]|uniref:proline-rich protein 29-like n=1 Tax=Labeo rohita TaxID=84645 RepID=UPI0021E272BF|nr:proline-rich protein 29-like [Labeo rohita]
MMMSWTNFNEKQWPEDSFNVQILQQPAPQATTIFQQFPATEASCFAPGHPGHIRKDLVELMMIQNAQMHQITMNNLTMSVLNTFDYTHTPENARINMVLEEEPDIYHHYYTPMPGLSYPGWMPFTQPPIQTSPHDLQNIQEPPNPAQPVHMKYKQRRTVPPPPPPSAAQTVDADNSPAPEFYIAERGQ